MTADNLHIIVDDEYATALAGDLDHIAASLLDAADTIEESQAKLAGTLTWLARSLRQYAADLGDPGTFPRYQAGAPR